VLPSILPILLHIGYRSDRQGAGWCGIDLTISSNYMEQLERTVSCISAHPAYHMSVDMTAGNHPQSWMAKLHRNCTTLCITGPLVTLPQWRRARPRLRLRPCISGMMLNRAVRKLACTLCWECQLGIIQLQPPGHKTSSVITPSGNPRLPAVLYFVGLIDRDYKLISNSGIRSLR
jgi:hypothetical protein